MKLPEKGEPLQLGDIAEFTTIPRFRKALRRLAAEMASKSICQLVMWRWPAGWTGTRIAQISQNWANRYELTLARDFVEHLDTLPEGETGRLLFEVEGTDAASEAMAAELKKALRRKMVLGLVAEVGIPARPEGPAVAVPGAVVASEALVQVDSSDATARNWVPFGKFTLPVVQEKGKLDAVAIRRRAGRRHAQSPGSGAVEQGRQGQGEDALLASHRQCVSLVLNGLAALGTASKPDETPKVLSGICVRRGGA